MDVKWICATLGVALAMVGAASTAHAERPTEGGLFGYDPSDTIEWWDEPGGTVRVHYSVSGPNVTILDDDDGDGVPDYPQLVANTTAAVFAFFEDRGFHPPVGETDIGLGELGGSAAFDVYLVDFGGNADGSFGLDGCEETPLIRCAGYFSMENDFLGYNYPSLEHAASVLASHELFHAVQAAYTIGLPVWFSEGSATWAEKLWDPDSSDFLRATAGYLRDPYRSIDRVPPGPVPAFAYGTGLFLDYLTTRYDDALMVELMEALDSTGDGVDVVAYVEELLGGPETLREDWLDFVVWNLASGPRAGGLAGHVYAAALIGIEATAEGANIDHDNRFYPLAASYYRIDHPGGRLYFGIAAPAPELRFGLHPVQGGASDGPVAAAVATWTGDATHSWAVADGAELPAGGYWLWGTKPERGTASTHVRVCVGDASAASQCAPSLPEPIDPPTDPPVDRPAVDAGGCQVGGGASGLAGGWWLLAALLLPLWGFRRGRARA